jgi:hypothetical protein
MENGAKIIFGNIIQKNPVAKQAHYTVEQPLFPILSLDIKILILEPACHKTGLDS